MNTMSISKFKAQALQVLAEIAQTKETIIITKRGKPLAQISPIQNTNPALKLGQLRDTFLYEDDIATPLGESDWEVLQ